MKFLTLLLLFLSLGLPSAQAQVCRPADSTSAGLIRELKRYASALSGDERIMRDTLRLPFTSPAQVVLVTSESTCRKANTAYQTAVANSGGTGLTGRVYLIKVGAERYAVLDPNYNAGTPGAWTVVIFDSRFKMLSSY
jgi:hypothetical protein